MTITAQEAFTKTVLLLSPTERLRLAALILQDLAKPDIAIVDRGEEWTEQDQNDLTAASLKYAAELYPEEQELV